MQPIMVGDNPGDWLRYYLLDAQIIHAAGALVATLLLSSVYYLINILNDSGGRHTLSLQA